MTKVEITQEQSEKLKLNKTDMTKLGKSFGLAFGGFCIAFLADMIPMIDYGIFSELIYSMSPFILNILRKILEGKK
jgi:hypothetical protein